VKNVTERFLRSQVQGYLWLVVGGLLLLGAAVKPAWFILQIPGFPIPVGALAMLYGLVNLILHRHARTQLKLSPQDVERHGEALAKITKGIMHHWEAGMSVKAIALKYEREKHIPQRVILLYIIELLRDLQERQKRESLTQIVRDDDEA
jgi:hypothetical protein